MSCGQQDTNPEGDVEVYVISAADGSSKANLTDNGAGWEHVTLRGVYRWDLNASSVAVGADGFRPLKGLG